MGRSLLPAMVGTQIRDNMLTEYNSAGAAPGNCGPVHARTLSTKTRRNTRCNEAGWGELYDLISDPNETHNLLGRTWSRNRTIRTG